MLFRRKKNLRAEARNSTRRLLTEHLEARNLLAGIYSFHNFLGRENVNGDVTVSPIDVLHIVNELNGEIIAGESGRLPDHTDPRSSLLGLDVSCDGFVSPIDALIVINALNANNYSAGMRFDTQGGYVVPEQNINAGRCSPRIVEGDSFQSQVSLSFEVPHEPSVVEIQLRDIAFSEIDRGFIRDAVEVSLLDAAGNTLVATIGGGSDAVFNATEGVERQAADGIIIDGDKITIGLVGIPAGTDATASVRILNNDGDDESSVIVDAIDVIARDVAAVLPRPASLSPNPGSFDQPQVTGRELEPRRSPTYSGQPDIVSSSGSGFALAIDPSDDADYRQMLAAESLTLSGDATAINTDDGDVIRLSSTETFQVGSAISNDTYSLEEFSTFFQFRIEGAGGGFRDFCNAQEGADGIAFALRQPGSALGSAGGFLGYDGVDNSIHIEFDTWCNAAQFADPSSNHIGIGVNGEYNHRFEDTVDIYPDFDDGNLWSAWVDYDGTSLEVRVSQSELRPSNPQLVKQIDIPAVIGSDMGEVGFTASTGLNFENLDIVRWKFEPQYNPIHSSQVNIRVDAPGSALAGSQALLSGVVESFDLGKAVHSSTLIEVNGLVAGQIDEAGRFFAYIDINKGNNIFDVRAIASSGIVAQTQVVVLGLSDTSGIVDFSTLQDATTEFVGLYSRTTMNEASDRLLVELLSENQGGRRATGPVLVAVKNVSDPSVLPMDIDGRLLDGTPYYEFAGAELTVAASDTLGPKVITFYNPKRIQFDYDLVFLADPNGAPQFSSTPPIRAEADEAYRYEFSVADPENDPVAYALIEGPSQVQLDGMTGVLIWTPTNTDIGRHTLAVEVRDDQEGSSIQRWSVDVVEQSANHPPIISSQANTSIHLLQDGSAIYEYQVIASDIDGDTLTYRLLQRPNGMLIDPSSGLLAWNPSVAQIGNHTVTLEVSDGLGGLAEQQFVLCVHRDPQNNSPHITSTPIASTQPRRLDTQPKSYAGIEFPLGDISFADRVVSYMPGPDVAGSYLESERALGPPDQRGQTSLGNEGVLIVEFTDNGLVDQQVVQDGLDLWIFEEGPVVEFFQVEISQDGLIWIDLGEFSGQPTGIDIGPFVQPGDVFRFVRLTDVLPEQSGSPFGEADIDAIGAIGSIAFSDYHYDVTAIDADDDDLNFEVVDGPAGLHIASDSGRISWSNALPLTEVFYSADFENGLPPEFDTRGRTAPVEGYQGLGNGNYKFDGNYLLTEGGPTTLTLTGLPPHETLDIEYLLAVIDSWDGLRMPPEAGPDLFSVKVDGELIFAQHFENALMDGNQEYVAPPGVALGDPIYAQRARSNGSIFSDAGYDMSRDPVFRSIPHTSDTLTIEWLASGLGWQGGTDESWALDNVRIVLNNSQAIPVTIQASDGRGGVALQEFAIAVPPPGRSTIEGIKFHDVNGDGVQQSGEPPLANFTIYLDGNDNGRLDFGEHSTQTDADGAFRFELISAGEYHIADAVTLNWTHATSPVMVTVNGIDSATGVLFATSELALVAQSISIAPTADIETRVGSVFAHQANASHSRNDTIEYRLAAAPNGMAIDPLLGKLFWVPKPSQEGSHEVVVVATSSSGTSNSQRFKIEVLPFNAPPSLFSPSVTTVVATRDYRQPFYVLDENASSVDLVLSQAPPGMRIEQIDTRDSTGAVVRSEQVLRWTPGIGAAGAYPVTIQMTDELGQQANESFEIEVIDVIPNRSPVITSAYRDNLTPGVAFKYFATATDLDSDIVFWSLESKPVGMTITDSGFIEWTPTIDQIGANEAILVAFDRKTGIDRQRITVDVGYDLVNEPPVFRSTPQTIASVEHGYSYQPVTTDPDADILSFSLVSAPMGMTLHTESGRLSWKPTDQQYGSHLVELRAIDAMGATSSQSFTVEVVCNNIPPVINSTPATIALSDRSYLYPVLASDPERETLTFALLAAPVGMEIGEQSGIISWTPSVGQIGAASVSLAVTDIRGARTVQNYELEVIDSTLPIDPSDPNSPTFGNRPPVITSTPRFLATADRNYLYHVNAIELDGDAITYGLISAPAAMTIDPAAGDIRWTPGAADLGTHLVTLFASDVYGVRAFQNYSLNVTQNSAPQFVSSPVELVASGAVYRYAASAQDDDRDTLKFTVVNGPDGLIINTITGIVEWQTELSDIGIHQVSIAVDDGRDSQLQDYMLEVVPDQTPPTIELASSHTLIDIGGTITFQIAAFDDIGIADTTLHVGGVQIPLTANGIGYFTGQMQQLADVVATARDGAGNESQATLQIRVLDPTDDRGPSVTITSPVYDAEIDYVTDIVGSITVPDGQTLEFYRVEMASSSDVDLFDIGADDPSWKTIAEGVSEIEAGVLATFDPTVLRNGSYAFRVVAFNTNGQGWAEPLQLHAVGQAKLGQFNLEFTDLSIPLSGIPIEIVREYNTLDASHEGDFGFGWTMKGMDPQILESGLGTKGGLFSNGRTFVPGETKVYLTNPAGQRVGFSYSEELVSGGPFSSVWRPVYTPDPGVYDSLTSPGTITRGLFGFFDYNPSEYTLTTKEGLAYQYTEVAGLQSITDLNGNVVTFSPDGIEHSGGERIAFERDHRGRIARIVLPNGDSAEYAYDIAGDLLAYTNQAGLKQIYSYYQDPGHYLDESFDSLGNRSLKVVYDTEGRFEHVEDALGQIVSSQDNDLLARVGVVRDARGNETRLEFNDRGNVLVETDPRGFMKLYSYDDPRNPDLETRIVEKDGHVTTREFDERGNLLKNNELGPVDAPFAEPIVTSYTFDAGNRVTSVTDARNSTTSFRYDPQGNLVELTNALDDSSLFTYDGSGNVATFTDFKGNVTQFSDYVGGQPKLITYADGTQQRFEYNIYGQTTYEAYLEPDGTTAWQRTQKFDLLGRLIEEVLGSDADGSATTRKLFYSGELLDWEIVVHPESLDADSNLLESPTTPVADRKSSITDYEYDANQRLVRQIDAEGGVIDFRYDADGNRIALRDPVGNLTTWIYDVNGQPIEERDPLYWHQVRTDDPELAALSDDDFLERVAPLDPASAADPLLDDPSGASCDTNTGAEHVIVTCYDGVGNVETKIDRNGRRIEYDYNFMRDQTEERWYSVDGGLVRTLNFTFDVVGNMLTANDPDSSLVFTYDVLNQLQTADNAGTPQVPRVLLTYSYDQNGNVESVIDDSGVTVASEYNERNLLDTRQWFDLIDSGGAEIAPVRFEFGYTALGRQSQVDRYASFDRTNLIGFAMRSYDQAGRSMSIDFTNAAGEVLSAYSFTYDSLDRMDSSSRAGVEAVYTHDLAGQLTSALRSNALDETFVYDANGNRNFPGYVTGVGNRLASDGDFAYEYDGEGNRVAKIAIDGDTVTAFEYDHRNRLVRITKRDIGDNEVEVAAHSYDALNRRIIIETADETAVMVYDREQAWVEFNEMWETTARLLHTDQVDTLLAIAERGGRPVFVNTDLVGSVVGYVRDDGALENTISYQSFGKLADGELKAGFGFTGRAQDSNQGLNFYRTRFYEPESGLFMSEDSIRQASGETNLVRYVNNAPLTHRDPHGEISFTELATEVRIAIYLYAPTAAIGAAEYCIFVGLAGLIAPDNVLGGIISTLDLACSLLP